MNKYDQFIGLVSLSFLKSDLEKLIQKKKTLVLFCFISFCIFSFFFSYYFVHQNYTVSFSEPITLDQEITYIIIVHHFDFLILIFSHFYSENKMTVLISEQNANRVISKKGKFILLRYHKIHIQIKFINYRVGQKIFGLVIHMENTTRINFHVLPTINLLLPYSVSGALYKKQGLLNFCILLKDSFVPVSDQTIFPKAFYMHHLI